MKKILAIEETVDNWGNTERVITPGEILEYLTDPATWSDDLILTFEEDSQKGVCFIDDLIGEKVLVGDEVLTVKEF